MSRLVGKLYGCQLVELFRKRGTQHAWDVRCFAGRFVAALRARARGSCASEVGASGSVVVDISRASKDLVVVGACFAGLNMGVPGCIDTDDPPLRGSIAKPSLRVSCFFLVFARCARGADVLHLM